MMRPGDAPKLAPQQEQELLDKLRMAREEKAQSVLQAEVQTLSAKMVHMDLADVPEEAKRLSEKEKALQFAPDDARIALSLNALLRMVSPPEAPASAKGKGGGGGKKQNAVKAAAAKVVEGAPPDGPAVRKAVKKNAAFLKTAIKGRGAAGQLALLKALQSWLLSAQGASALEHTGKILVVLYDADVAEEEVLTKYWDALASQRTREEAELVEAQTSTTALKEDKEKAEEAVKTAEKDKLDAAYALKQAEQYSQSVRCGGNPSKEEEAAEKAAIPYLKKAIEFHTQTTKVLAARSKNLTEANAEYEPAAKLLEERKMRKEVGIELFAKHAAPFFEWLAADDDDDDDEAAAKPPKAKAEDPVEVS